MCLIGYLQSLDISREARNAHQGLVRHLEYSLEVAVDRHELGREACIGRYGHAVLSFHGHHRVAVVCVDSSRLQIIKSFLVKA